MTSNPFAASRAGDASVTDVQSPQSRGADLNSYTNDKDSKAIIDSMRGTDSNTGLPPIVIETNRSQSLTEREHGSKQSCDDDDWIVLDDGRRIPKLPLCGGEDLEEWLEKLKPKESIDLSNLPDLPYDRATLLLKLHPAEFIRPLIYDPDHVDPFAKFSEMNEVSPCEIDKELERQNLSPEEKEAAKALIEALTKGDDGERIKALRKLMKDMDPCTLKAAVDAVKEAYENNGIDLGMWVGKDGSFCTPSYSIKPDGHLTIIMKPADGPEFR